MLYLHKETGVLTIKELDIIVIDYLLSLPYIYIMMCQIKTCEILGCNGKHINVMSTNITIRLAKKKRITNLSKYICSWKKLRRKKLRIWLNV